MSTEDEHDDARDEGSGQTHATDAGEPTDASGDAAAAADEPTLATERLTAQAAEPTHGTEVAAPPPPPPPPPPKRLLRSRDDRVIAGVAGGLGRYFGIDPVIVRIAAVVSIFFGGVGIVAYLLSAIFIPADDGTGRPAPGSRLAAAIRVLGVAALVLIAIAGFGALAAGALLATGVGYGLVVVGAIALLGIALLAASFGSGARWLILPALALTIGVGVATAADLDLEGGFGEETHRPAAAAQIPDGGYEFGVGRLAIDLRDIEWRRDQVVHLDARLGIGELVVAVPAGVCVEADASAGAGRVRVAGQETDGTSVDLTVASGSEAAPRLVLDADVDLGAINVINDDATDILSTSGHNGRGLALDAARYRAANARACAR